MWRSISVSQARSSISGLLRPALVLLAVFLVVGLGGIGYQGLRTLQKLTVVEADRDRWQRPADVIRYLNLKNGNTVVDFGSGAGYFALKLSDAVGHEGQVIAVDLRKLSLLFLRVRALVRDKHNIRTVPGDPDNPHLAADTVDSVLVVNTYHELTEPQSILRQLSQALRQGGRLVIVDRIEGADEHHVSPALVERALRNEGFEITARDDSFIQRPGEDSWWLIVAVKP
jgi:SAM-dependent methyltransferase